MAVYLGSERADGCSAPWRWTRPPERDPPRGRPPLGEAKTPQHAMQHTSGAVPPLAAARSLRLRCGAGAAATPPPASSSSAQRAQAFPDSDRLLPPAKYGAKFTTEPKRQRTTTGPSHASVPGAHRRAPLRPPPPRTQQRLSMDAHGELQQSRSLLPGARRSATDMHACVLLCRRRRRRLGRVCHTSAFDSRAHAAEDAGRHAVLAALAAAPRLSGLSRRVAALAAPRRVAADAAPLAAGRRPGPQAISDRDPHAQRDDLGLHGDDAEGRADAAAAHRSTGVRSTPFWVRRASLRPVRPSLPRSLKTHSGVSAISSLSRRTGGTSTAAKRSW